MTITPFGLVFMTLGFTLLAARREWLLPLLVVSAGLHAFAVVIIGPATPGKGLGVSPWLFTCSLIFVHLITLIEQNRRIELGATRKVRLIFFGWMIYTIWCVLSAFTLPFIFEGLPINTLARWKGFDIPTEPMRWTVVNAIQAFNTTAIGMLMVYLLQVSKDVAITSRIFTGFAISIGLSAILSVFQRAQFMEFVSLFDLFNASLNPSYQQNSMLSGDGTYLRLNWPFSEPSYASVWYGAMVVGGLSIFLFSRNVLTSFSFFVLGSLGLLNSMGGTGLAGSFSGVLMLLIFSVIVVAKNGKNSNQLLAKIIVFTGASLLLCLVYFIIQRNYSGFPNYYKLFETLINERVGRVDMVVPRLRSNLEAFEIVINTWGLGVGLGSNRASSYLMSMLSNIGVLGFLLFVVLFFFQLFMILKSNEGFSDFRATFFAWGSIGCFFSMSFGIPDMNFPAWWIWVLAGFGALVTRKSVSGTLVCASP